MSRFGKRCRHHSYTLNQKGILQKRQLLPFCPSWVRDCSFQHRPSFEKGKGSPVLVVPHRG